MLPYFWYILKVIICSGILFGYYWLFLRNKIFHQYNRFYLLSAIILSLLLPMVKIGFWQQNDTPQASVIKVLQAVSAGDEYMSNVVITANKSGWSFHQLYPLLYWMISVVFFFMLVKTLFAIRSLLKRYPVQEIEKVSFVNTNDKSTPFSFFKYIFWNVGIDMNTHTGKQIFKHEVAHIQEKHTHDKLFVNMLLIFFWCNPFFWLNRKELNMIHEFIADRKAVEDSDTASFAAMILQATYPQHRFELTNNFFYSPIKRRLLMLTKNNNPKVNYIGRIMVLPLTLLIFAAFTFKTKRTDNIKDHLLAAYEVPTGRTSFQNDTIPSTGMFVNVKNADPNYMQSEEYKTKALILVDSKEIGNFGSHYLDKNENNYNSVMIYGPAEAIKIFGEKGKYGAIKLTQKDITFITAKSVTYDEKNKSIKLTGPDITLKGNLSSTLIYINGKVSSQEELNNIDPEKVSSVNILKGEKLDDFAEAKGKTAIIQVNLKPNDLEEVVVTGFKTAQPPIAIALDKFSVLYIGIDNPVTIAVPGIPSDQLLVNITNGSKSGRNGKYIVRVTAVGEATIAVSTIKNNQRVILSTQSFQIKRIPDPTDTDFPDELKGLYKLDSSRISQLKQKYILEQQNLATPKLYFGDVTGSISEVEFFKKQKEMRIRGGYKFLSAVVYFTTKGHTDVVVLDGNSLSPIRGYLDRCESGSVITFDNIRVSDPNGQVRGIEGISYSLYSVNEVSGVAPAKLDYAEKQLLAKNADAALEKAVVERKLNDQELYNLKQKLMLEQQNIAKSDYTEKAILYEKELLVQQSNLVFTKVEVSPMFTGGDEAWRKYLEKNLGPGVPLNEGWKAGKYTVIVKFIVRMDGTVSNVGTENYKGSKTSKHCISIIQHAPKWQPAIQNGKRVNAYKKQPITFVIEE